MYKLTYRIQFQDTRIVLMIFVNGQLADELTLPNLSTFILPSNVTLKGLWQSWVASISTGD